MFCKKLCTRTIRPCTVVCECGRQRLTFTMLRVCAKAWINARALIIAAATAPCHTINLTLVTSSTSVQQRAPSSEDTKKNFNEEIFKIIRVLPRQGLYTYVLADLNGEIIDGFFYNKELVLVGQDRLADDKTFKIERFARTKGRGANKQALIKWLGNPDKYNSWVIASQLKSLS